ncbi:MAG: beta strand repeat-containing protein, partial [Prosthecobacter sp.]
GGAGTLGKNVNALGNGSDTIQNAGSGLLTLSGTLTKAGTILTLAGGASGIRVTGIIAGLPASSDLIVTGLVTLASANTFNGPAIIGSGATLNINHKDAIPTALTINGGTIDNTSGSSITLAGNPTLNINSNFTFTGTNNLNLGTGAVTLNANRTVTLSGGTLTIGGSISGSFALSGTGPGTLVLTGASNYTGTTNVESGTTLSVGGNGSLGDISSGTIVGAGSTLSLIGVNYTDLEPLNITGSGTGGGALVASGNSSFAGPITLDGNATIGITPGGTFTLSGPITKNGTALTLGGGGTFIITGSIGGASPNSDLVVSGSTVNLNEANTYNGPTFIQNAGVLNANVNNALPTTSGRTAIIMNNTAGNLLNLGASQSIASLAGGTNDAVTLGSNNLTIGESSGSATSTYAGAISGTGGSLTKDLASTLVLSGANSYTGATTVSSGTLQMAKQTALYNNTPASWTAANINVKSGATLAFNVGGTGEFTTANVTTLLTNLAASSSATNGMNAGSVIGFDTTNAAGGTFTVADNVTDTTGASGGLRGLTKLGTGTLVLTGQNTYTGDTHVIVGTLEVNNTSGSGTGGGSVILSGSSQLSGSGSIAGSTILGSGTILSPGRGDAQNDNRTLTFTAASSTAIQVNNGAQIRLGISSPTNTNLLTYLGDKFLFNSTQYNTAVDLFNAQSGARDIWNTAPTHAANHDFINLTGSGSNLQFNGTGSILIQKVGSNTFTSGQVFNLIDWTQMSGADPVAMTFNTANLTLPDLSASGLGWDSTAFTTYGIVVVTPEPSRTLFLMLGLLGLLMRRRRKV